MKSNIIHRITNFEFQNIVVIDNKKGATQYCFGLIRFDVIHKITFWQKSLAPSADHIKCSKPRFFCNLIRHVMQRLKYFQHSKCTACFGIAVSVKLQPSKLESLKTDSHKNSKALAQ